MNSVPIFSQTLPFVASSAFRPAFLKAVCVACVTEKVVAAAEKLAPLGENVGSEVTLLIEELEGLADGIAKADEMRVQASVAMPDKDCDAAKWHEVALMTIDMSQQELLKRQKAALQRLVRIACVAC